ncbi:His-Xaa-Ser system radical SAM maturase HxsC [Luteibacter sp. HA06]
MSARLDGRSEMAGWTAGLYKVAGLAQFASGVIPPERLVLDARDPAVHPHLRSLSTLPFAGVLTDAPMKDAHLPWIATRHLDVALAEGDVIEVAPTTARVARRYQRGARGNILFATERCNSFCLMCSQPPREVADHWRPKAMKDLVDLVDRDAPLLTITGGEPTLLGDGLVDVISHASRVLPGTDIHVLSNGRTFSEEGFAGRFAGLHPRLSWGVPLYGDHFGLHDYIVQRAGAFAETVRGLYALRSAGQAIEIRVVLVMPVVERIEAIAHYLYRAFPFASHIALMGLEPTGFAKAHHELLWVDPVDFGPALSRATLFLARRGMAVSLYNLPLCVLPEDLRPFAAQSISDWKQTFHPACNGCALRARCGGFFAWSTGAWTSRAIGPINGTEPCKSH